MGVEGLRLCSFLCEISMELSRKLNNGLATTQAYSYEGAALHQMGRFEDSQSIYQKYFEHVIRTSRKITDFLYPLEGLLRNCKKSVILSHIIMLKKVVRAR